MPTPTPCLALGRAAILPLREGARLELVHVIPIAPGAAIPPNVKLAARKALNASRADLETRARRAGRRDVAVTASLHAGKSGPEIHAAAERFGADLVVLGRRARPRARDFFLGSTASRILRMANAPVLIGGTAVRGGYQRVAVALDLDRDVAKVAALAVRMPECRPDVTCGVRAIHAYDAPFEGRISTSGPPGSRRRYRAGIRADARVALRALLDHHRGAVARLFLGTVAEDAIREARCDLLVWRC